MTCLYCNVPPGTPHEGWCPVRVTGAQSPIGMAFTNDPVTGDSVCLFQGDEIGRLTVAKLQTCASADEAIAMSREFGLEMHTEAMRRLGFAPNGDKLNS